MGNYNLLVVLYGCEILSLMSMEERRLGVFQNRVPKRTFEPKEGESIKRLEKIIMRDFIKENEKDGTCSTHGREVKYVQDLGKRS
jgi:hypothetical protein